MTAFDVVTADAKIRRVTPTANPDLFWALRGGKGAAGVVTAVEFELLDIPEFNGGCRYFEGVAADRVLHAWASWADDLPEQGSPQRRSAGCRTGPGSPRRCAAVPASRSGSPGSGTPTPVSARQPRSRQLPR